MASVETASTHKLESLVEGQSFVDIVTEALQVAQCGVTFVAVVDVFLDAELLQREHTANTQEDFLLQTVLPVAAVESVGDGLVELGVHLVVGIEQIERDATHIDAPYVSVNLIVHVRNIDNQGIAIGIELTLHGERVEVLCFVVGYLLALHVQALSEIAETIQETDSTHVDIAVGGLFQIVAGKHAQTARIDLKNLVQAVLHAEISHGGTLGVGFHIHVLTEELIDVLHVFHDFLILHNLGLAVIAQTVQEKHGVVVHFLIKILVEAAPKLTGFEVPCPPHVVS